jgi:glutamate dehydrogenase
LIEVAVGAKLSPETVACVYFALGSALEMSWLRDSITTLPAKNHWQNKARAALLNGLYDQQRYLTAELLRLTESAKTPGERVQSWLDRNRGGVDRCQALFADLRSSGQPDLAMLSVALRQLADLSETGVIDAIEAAKDEPAATAVD